jgi:hypothetical protein
VLYNLALDQDGSLLTGTRLFGLDPTNFGGKQLVGQGSSDMLVAKLDPKSGNAIWALAAGDGKDQAANTGVAATSAGIGVAGTFLGTLDITNGAGPIAPIVNPGSTNLNFLAGLKSTDGTPLWLKAVNLGTTGGINQIAGQYSKDYFAVCGSASNSAATLAATGTPGGGKDVLLAVVKASDGTVLWAKIFGGAMDQACTAAALDDGGNVVFAGTYTGSLDFGTGALSPAPTGATTRALWVAKFNATTGALLAATGYGTSGSAVPKSVATDAQGDVAVVGQMISALTFGTTTLTPVGPGDAFAVKLSGSSLAPMWTRHWGGTVGNGTDGAGAAFDSTGSLVVVGSFAGSIDIGGSGTGAAAVDGGAAGAVDGGAAGGLQAKNPGSDTFVVTLSGASGETLCAQGYGDLAGPSTANTVVIDRWAAGSKKDSIAISGVYTGVIDFGPPTTALASVAAVGYLLGM